MLLASDNVSSSVAPMLAHQNSESVAHSSTQPLDQYKVIRRNGSVVPFEPAKISIAVTKALSSLQSCGFWQRWRH